MPNKSEIGPNAAREAEIVALLGVQRFCVLLDILDDRLRYIMNGFEDGSDLASLIELVHQSQGSAGSLGLGQIAGSLGNLERDMRASLQCQSDRRETNFVQTGLMTNAVRTMLDELHLERSNVAMMLQH